MRSVEELAHSIVFHWGSGTVETRVLDNAPHEAGLLHLNCDKASQQLGWLPRWNYEQTVAETVDWYRAVSSGKDAGIQSSNQIIKYMEKDL